MKKKQGVPLQGAQVVRDLGVDFTAGLKRHAPTHQSRLSVVKRRLGKTNLLVGKTKKLEA